MTVAEWLLFAALTVEFLIRVAVEIREVRMSGGRLDRFAFFRVVPVVNDIFPAEAHSPEIPAGAFVKAHEKVHAEMHHGALRRAFQLGFALLCALALGVAGVYLNFNLFELLLLFHLMFSVSRLFFHGICFAEEFEADALAAKRVQRGVAIRALESLRLQEFPRTLLFAFLYRTHPTAQMRLERITGTSKKIRR